MHYAVISIIEFVRCIFAHQFTPCHSRSAHKRKRGLFCSKTKSLGNSRPHSHSLTASTLPLSHRFISFPLFDAHSVCTHSTPFIVSSLLFILKIAPQPITKHSHSTNSNTEHSLSQRIQTIITITAGPHGTHCTLCSLSQCQYDVGQLTAPSIHPLIAQHHIRLQVGH